MTDERMLRGHPAMRVGISTEDPTISTDDIAC